MENKKILITGASSIIGEALFRIIKAETTHSIVLMSSLAQDLPEVPNLAYYEISSLDKQSTKKICLDERPDIIINTAGINDPAICESEKRLAWELNAYVVENLARMAKIIEAHLITFSTEQIFDGKKGPYTEDDKPNPINYYGKSKLAAENFCRTGCDKYTIIRTTPVYGYSSMSKFDFVQSIYLSIQSGEKYLASPYRFTNPVYADDLATIVYKVIEKERFGIYNAGAADWMSEFEIVQAVADVFNLNPDMIKSEISSTEALKCRIPEKCGLTTLKTETDLGFKLCTLESGLQSLKFKREKIV